MIEKFVQIRVTTPGGHTSYIEDFGDGEIFEYHDGDRYASQYVGTDEAIAAAQEVLKSRESAPILGSTIEVVEVTIIKEVTKSFIKGEKQ